MRCSPVRMATLAMLLVALVLPGLPTPAVRGQEATPATASTATDHVLRIGRVGGFPDSFDPHGPDATFAVPTLVFEGLTRPDEQLNTVPAAAESWEFSDDGLTLTFHLRDGLTYSDGSPLTAERFRYAIERNCDPHTESPYVNFLALIAGCEAFATSLEAETATPMATPGAMDDDAYEAAKANLGVTALDDQTLEIQLTRPAAYMPAIASTWLFFPVQQEIVAADPDDWWRDSANWVGNGPFAVSVVDDEAPDQSVTFVPNEHYWAGRPKLDQIVYRYYDDDEASFAAYTRGELEISRAPYPYGAQPEIADDPELSQEIRRIPAAVTITYGMNQNEEPFQDQKVREAFAYGFDREGFCREIWQDACIPTSTWIPPGVPGHIETDAFAFDPEAAKQALAESSYGGPENLPPITLYHFTDEENQDIAEWLAENYRSSLGVEFVLAPVTDEEWEEMVETGFVPQFDWWSWGQDYPDPQIWMSPVWKCDQGVFAEPLGYCNPELDALVEQADQETDPEKRMELYEEAQRLLIADVPVAIAFNDTNAVLIKPSVTGYVTTPSDYWPGWNSLLTIDVEA